MARRRKNPKKIAAAARKKKLAKKRNTKNRKRRLALQREIDFQNRLESALLHAKEDDRVQLIDLSNSCCPLASVDRRLRDSLVLLREIKAKYFDPDGFRINLNNAIHRPTSSSCYAAASPLRFA